MKKIVTFYFRLFICVTISSTIGIDAFAYAPAYEIKTENYSPLSDIIEWRYKTINGKLYKRQYNCTKDRWIGSWQLIP